MTIRNGKPCAVCGFSITNWRHTENEYGTYDNDMESHPYVKGGTVSEPRTKATHPADAPNRTTTLPEDATERKKYPVASGVLDYFPDALVAVARVSYEGNQQHNPGEPLHWARGKSTDQDDTIIRHFLERGTKDKDGQRHSAKLAWRALALLQLEIEAEQVAVPKYSGMPGDIVSTRTPDAFYYRADTNTYYINGEKVSKAEFEYRRGR